jgi:hypothetical protein
MPGRKMTFIVTHLAFILAVESLIYSQDSSLHMLP